MTDMVKKVWRAIAIENGDDPDQIPRHKSHWNKEQGQFGGRFRDINEPFVSDYEAMARAAIRALMEPTAEIWLIYSREHNAWWRPNSAGYTNKISAAGRYTEEEARKRCSARGQQLDGSPSEVAVIDPDMLKANLDD